MKTLLFTLEYPPFKGGVANVYENIIKYYPEPDNIFVLHNNGGELINNKLPALKWLPAVWRLFRAVKKNKIDHILVGQILPLGTAAFIISKFIKIKYSVILHGMDFTYAIKTARKKWLTGKILKNAENVICMNSYTAGLAREFLKEGTEKITVINPGVDKELRISKPRDYELRINLIKKYNLENKIILLSVGRLVKRKGVDMVLKSLPEVLKVASNLVYVIGGAGADEKYLKNINKELQKTGEIIFLGKISDEEKRGWFNLCDIFIMPSRKIGDDFEGFGIVLLEANMAGKPVIAGDSGGISDAVENGVNGLLVDPNDINDIIYAIVKLAKDKELREKLGKQGKERAEREFGWERQAGKIYRLVTRNP